MSLTSTIYKIALQITDMHRNYYHDHAFTLSRHPSETDERLMVRILAFARHASETLAFAKGRLGAGVKTVGGKPSAGKLSDPEPDLWEKDLTGAVELWIEVGLPDERPIRQACGRAKEVVVYAYGGNKADRWWEQNQRALEKSKNLTVVSVSKATTSALAKLVQRDLKLDCMVQDGEMWLGDGNERVVVELGFLKGGP